MKFVSFIYFACASLLLTSVGIAAESESKQEGVKEMPSGIKIEVLQKAPPGAPSPKKGDTVTVQYTGWLDDQGKPGKKFDSSVDRGVPFTFKVGVGQVIKGWDLGILEMKKGEKIRLFIPSDLAYGSRGAGSAIPPNSSLIFDVDLINIKN